MLVKEVAFPSFIGKLGETDAGATKLNHNLKWASYWYIFESFAFF